MIRLPNTYISDMTFEEFAALTDEQYGDNWFTYNGVDYRICFPNGTYAIVLDDDEFTMVFDSGTDSLEEFWEKPVFGYRNFKELYEHIRPYWR